MSTRSRGFCLIINNVNFHNKAFDREGGEVDERELVKLFEELFFTVSVHRDQKGDEMRAVARTFAAKDHSQFDAFVFIVMSHGGDQDVIYGVDKIHTRVEDLMAYFTAANCKTLRNKPKLFFIQTCRGSSVECLSPSPDGAHSDDVPDSTLSRSVRPKEADCLLAFGTAPGYVSWRDPQRGSRFIQVNQSKY